MTKIDQKLAGISRILSGRNFSTLSMLEDLTEDELLFLNLKFNIRFCETVSGFKCFISSNIGKAGIAQNKVSALTFMLDHLQFRPNLEEDILLQLEAFFSTKAN